LIFGPGVVPGAGVGDVTRRGSEPVRDSDRGSSRVNLTTQFLLNNNTSAQIGYVGQIGQHLIIPEQANQWRTPGVATSAPFYNLVGSSGTVYRTQSEGVSNYNALQVAIRQRTNHGLEYTVNYTWAKSMTNNPGFYGVLGVDDSSVFQQNIYDPHGDYWRLRL
jgi:hypothetical protein